MSELLSDLTGYTVNPIALVVLLGVFLTIIIAGVRGMTGYLFGRSGAPALIAVLNRQAGTHR